MQVTISQMSQPEAEEIAAWHYEETLELTHG